MNACILYCAVLTELGERYSVLDWPGNGPDPKQGGKVMNAGRYYFKHQMPQFCWTNLPQQVGLPTVHALDE